MLNWISGPYGHEPECCGECCFGEFISGGSSEKETDFSNETDLSVNELFGKNPD